MWRARQIKQYTAAIALLLVPACGTAQKYQDDAAATYAEANFAQACSLLDARPTSPESRCAAIHLLKQATLDGHRNAPALLGIFYATGCAWPRNYQLALRYLSIASDRNHSKAQLMLALLYAKGLGTPRNPAKAVEHIRYAAMQGSPRAALLMFFCFYDAFGVPCSDSLALGWLENAAEFGSPDAQKLLKLYQKSPNFSKEVDFLRKKLDFFPEKM